MKTFTTLLAFAMIAAPLAVHADDKAPTNQVTRIVPRPVAPPRNDARSRQLHDATPHLVTVQSKIDAAQSESRGIERLGALEPVPSQNEVFREHLHGLSQDVKNDIAEARHHLGELHSSVQGIQVNPSVNNDIAQADRLLLDARGHLEQFDHEAENLRPNAVRDLGEMVSRELNDAKIVVNRVERNLR